LAAKPLLLARRSSAATPLLAVDPSLLARLLLPAGPLVAASLLLAGPPSAVVGVASLQVGDAFVPASGVVGRDAVARIQPESVVLDNPPAPVVGRKPLPSWLSVPRPRITFITSPAVPGLAGQFTPDTPWNPYPVRALFRD
jgi:hypothetical protein